MKTEINILFDERLYEEKGFLDFSFRTYLDGPSPSEFMLTFVIDAMDMVADKTLRDLLANNKQK